MRASSSTTRPLLDPRSRRNFYSASLLYWHYYQKSISTTRNCDILVVTFIMATQFVKWWRTKFHNNSSSSGSSSNSQGAVTGGNQPPYQQHFYKTRHGSTRSSSSSSSTTSASVDSCRSTSTSSDILLLNTGSHKCTYNTMSSVLGSDSSDGDHRSDTEDLLILHDDSGSSCNVGLVNAGLISSSSSSSDFSHKHSSSSSIRHNHRLKMKTNDKQGSGNEIQLERDEDDCEDLEEEDHLETHHHHRHECCSSSRPSSPTAKNVNNGSTKFEDFEYDIHLENGSNNNKAEGTGANEAVNGEDEAVVIGDVAEMLSPSTSSEEDRKEFSFTFYDLDGHGKITKDDIAGLVRSIYGAVNDSITVPQGGKKTIKVRLTVSPEQQQREKQNEASKLNNNNNETNNNYEEIQPKDNNIRTSSPRPSPATTTTTIEIEPELVKKQERQKLSKTTSNANATTKCHRSRAVRFSANSPKSTKTGKSKSNLDRFFKFTGKGNGPSCPGCQEEQQQQVQQRLHHRNLLTPGTRNSIGGPEVLFNDYSGGTPMKHRKKWRERLLSSATDCCKPQLFDLLQANMEKNNVSPCCRVDYSKLELQNNYRHQHHQQQFYSANSSPVHHVCTHNHLIDPKCPILPLLNNNTSPGVDNNNINVNNANVNTHFLNNSNNNILNKKYHHRSRSHDISQNIFKYQLLEAGIGLEPHVTSAKQLQRNLSGRSNCKCNLNNSNYQKHSHHEESIEILTGCILNSASSPSKNNNLSNFASGHHQMKHRNREQEHARAMTQVINWLEREHLGSSGTKFCSSPRKNVHHHHNHKPAMGGSPCSKNMDHGCTESPTAAKKHHHVHEHIHHHYHHHYAKVKETPIIV